MEAIKDILKRNDIKNTKYRLEILKLLICEEKRFIDIGEIHERIKSIFTKIDFSTVYRALELFEEKQIIYKTKINDKLVYTYKCKNINEHHHHLICKECGLKVNLNFCPFENDKNEYSMLGFADVEHKKDIIGICNKCKN